MSPPESVQVSSAHVADPVAALAQAREAMAAQRYETTVALLNQILDLPPNPASQDAQELIGNAREALGEIDRARVEYQLYLKLFANGDGVARVKSRLDKLGTAIAANTKSGKGKTGGAPQTTYWGSLSQSYYGGQSQIRDETTIITPATDATQIDVQNISSKDQSSLVSNADANARYRGNGWDNRFVFRDVHVLSLLSAQPTQNRLSALYADFKNEPMGFDARIGRQSSTSGGVLGRFDGVVAHYTISDAWRVGVLGGTPAEKGIGKRKYFYGATLDNDTLLDGLGVGLFAIEQRTESSVDRRALGTELRYFSQTASVFSLFDYDIKYHEVNVASVQGTLTMHNGATVNLLYDYRRSPTLQLTNALLGTPARSLKQLLLTEQQNQIEEDAVNVTPISKVALLGTTYPITEHWQLGLEARVSSLTSTHATATQPAVDGTGNIFAYTVQAIGTGIGSPNTVVVFNGSRLMSDAADSWLASMNTRIRPTEHWAVEPTLRFFVQDAINKTTLKRLSPTLRMTYQFGEKISLESEISYERSHSQGKLTDEKSKLLFYYIGYHWDF